MSWRGHRQSAGQCLGGTDPARLDDLVVVDGGLVAAPGATKNHVVYRFAAISGGVQCDNVMRPRIHGERHLLFGLADGGRAPG